METEEYDVAESSENEGGEGDITEVLEREIDEPVKRKFEDELNGPQKKRKTSGSVKPPTVQELNQLRETENLFNSSLFRLQIEEMLKEVQMKTKYQNLFHEWFNQFKSFVFELESSEEHDLSDESWLETLTVKPPVSLSPATDKGKFKFICPEDVTVGGSFSVNASLGPLYCIDLHLHIPGEFFHYADERNLRFDRKRAFYLTVLAEALIGSSLVEEVNFTQANGCILKPVLELKPSGKLGHYVCVLLWPVTNPGALVLKKLHPDRGNIRSEWLLKSQVSGGDRVYSPSSLYNSQVAQDLVWKQNQEMLEAELSAPSLQAGLTLLKIWLRQRHLDKGYGSFGGFIMSMYLVYLLQNRRLNKMMSSYQVARVTWNCLAQSDWTKEGISLGSTPDGPTVEKFHQHFEVVFVDVSGFCNLCGHVRKEIYMQVRIESAQAVTLLDTPGTQCFQALFMIPVEFEQSYEVIIRFERAHTLLKSVQKYCSLEQQLSVAGWMMPLLLNLIVPYLKQGLGDRISFIGLQPPKVARWACCEQVPAPSCISLPLILGLRLNSAKAFEPLEIGPEADHSEAAVFRSFWGSLSQLRRFRDGRICEAVLWDNDASPCKQAVQFVLENHVGLTCDSYLYISELTDNVLQLPRKKGYERMPSGNVAIQTIISSFDTLTKQLRALSDVTLSVNTVQGISPLFRYTDAFPPLALGEVKSRNFSHNSVSKDSLKEYSQDALKLTDYKRCPPYCAPVEAVMTLELSGKWPQNLEAVRRLKAAFCLQMAKALRNECRLSVQAHVDHVDIYKDGFVFRIWLAALKEVSLMKQQVDALGLTSYRDTPETQALEEKLVLLPKLSSSLHGLHQQFTGFAPTACLAKRWVSSQLMGPPHFPELVTELLVAYLFVSPEPFCRPVHSQLGLLHFLRLVSSTDWLTVPIIVNLNGEFSRERVAALETQFHSSRKSLPPLFVATPYDRSVSQCTRTAPTLQMLIRLGFLASEALKVFQEQLLVSKRPEILPIFRPNMAEYDVVIRLKTIGLCRVHESIDKQGVEKLLPITKYRRQVEEKIPIIKFDPVQCYLTELQEGYGNSALFFHDRYGGNVIGVVWKPLILQEQDFKISVLTGHKPAQKSVILNIDAILEDFQIIGSGLVESVDTRSQRIDQPQKVNSSGIT